MYNVSKWRIFCIEENDWTYGWLDNDAPNPTKCFNNTSHNVNLNSISIVDFIRENEVSIKEEKIKTQGNFRIEGFKFNIPVNTTYTYTHYIPYNINLLAIWYTVKSENIDDVLNAYCQPVINGTITSNIISPTTTLNIDNSFINIVNIGFVIIIERVSDNYKENLGEIVSIDTNTNTVIVTNSTSQNFSVNDKVFIQIHGIKNIVLALTGRHSTGSSKLGGTYLSSTCILTTTYQNKSLTDEKSFNYELEYLY